MKFMLIFTLFACYKNGKGNRMQIAGRNIKIRRRVKRMLTRTAPHRIAVMKIPKNAYQPQSNTQLAIGLCSLSVLIILGESDCLIHPIAGNPKSSVSSDHPSALLHTRVYHKIKPNPLEFIGKQQIKANRIFLNMHCEKPIFSFSTRYHVCS